MQDGVILCGSIKEKVTSVEHTEWVKSQKCVCVCVCVSVYVCVCQHALRLGWRGPLQVLESLSSAIKMELAFMSGSSLSCHLCTLAITKVIQYLITGKNRTLLSVFTTKLELPHSTHWYIYIYFYKSKHYFLNYALYMWIWIWFQIIISYWLIFC